MTTLPTLCNYGKTRWHQRREFTLIKNPFKFFKCDFRHRLWFSTLVTIALSVVVFCRGSGAKTTNTLYIREGAVQVY